MIEANFVNRQEDRFAAFKLSDEDKQEILKLARDPRIGEQAHLLYPHAAHAESFYTTLLASSCISLNLPLGWPRYDDALSGAANFPLLLFVWWPSRCCASWVQESGCARA